MIEVRAAWARACNTRVYLPEWTGLSQAKVWQASQHYLRRTWALDGRSGSVTSYTRRTERTKCRPSLKLKRMRIGWFTKFNYPSQKPQADRQQAGKTVSECATSRCPEKRAIQERTKGIGRHAGTIKIFALFTFHLRCDSLRAGWPRECKPCNCKAIIVPKACN